MAEIPYPPFPLKGDNCQCRACGKLFRRTSSFEAHRYGPYTERRCHDNMYLAQKGWKQDSGGFWRRAGRPIGPFA